MLGDQHVCGLSRLELAEKNPTLSVLAEVKRPTTARTTDGIISAVESVLALVSSITADDVASVNIGTTVCWCYVIVLARWSSDKMNRSTSSMR